MRIKDKINMNRDQLMENGPIVIGVLGDSVSHGSVAGGLMAQFQGLPRLTKNTF